MLNKFLFLLFMGNFNLHFAQENFIPYFNCTNEAEFWFYKQQYDSANFYYSKAFDKVSKPLDFDLYNYSRSLWSSGKQKEALNILVKIKSSFYSSKPKFDTTFFQAITSSDLDFIKEKITSNYQRLNQDSLSREERMIIYLDSIDESIRKLPKFSEVMTKNHEKQPLTSTEQKMVNDFNLSNQFMSDTLLKFTKKYGFPGGYDPSIQSVMVHFDSLVLLNNIDLLLNELKQGRLNPMYFAFATDRFLTPKNQACSKYGTYTKFDEKTFDYDAVFRARKEIGFSVYFPKNSRLYNKNVSSTKFPIYNHYAERKEKYHYCE